MIRFRTIEPETAAKAKTATPQAEAPRPAVAQDEPPIAVGNDAEAKPKGLTRKTPLRARKPDAVSLFDGKTVATDSGNGA